MYIFLWAKKASGPGAAKLGSQGHCQVRFTGTPPSWVHRDTAKLGSQGHCQAGFTGTPPSWVHRDTATWVHRDTAKLGSQGHCHLDSQGHCHLGSQGHCFAAPLLRQVNDITAWAVNEDSVMVRNSSTVHKVRYGRVSLNTHKTRNVRVT
jgi:hypothetical protein